MRSEEEVREFYRQYVYRYAQEVVDGDSGSANQYLGAAFAYGRTLERSMKQIDSDLKGAVALIEKEVGLDG